MPICRQWWLHASSRGSVLSHKPGDHKHAVAAPTAFRHPPSCRTFRFGAPQRECRHRIPRNFCRCHGETALTAIPWQRARTKESHTPVALAQQRRMHHKRDTFSYRHHKNRPTAPREPRSTGKRENRRSIAHFRRQYFTSGFGFRPVQSRAIPQNRKIQYSLTAICRYDSHSHYSYYFKYRSIF